MRISRRKLAVIASVLGAMLVAGTAFAYWTASGSGTGSSSAASGLGTQTVNGAVASGGLVPGGSKTVTFSATKTASDYHVGTVSLTSVTVDATHLAAGCDASWFSMSPVSDNEIVLAGSGTQTLTSTGTLSMANAVDGSTPPLPVNQDACKGATLTLNLSSN